ncbi:tyrosine-protein kinase Dnt [Eurytemora carolleeae]|uniref:tyrosine-protein kinase Dnt n=1 Tax=Eurytemora carolleeae TaxID=1294199 RepID=UPI000C75B1FA|nr:tyrosine-protein kinase Dnt [Eurytemora carolleeae]|eukprot:XP_023348429.1 tyrosine-protein kinase Dnt-like [Eurytemora affinis]
MIFWIFLLWALQPTHANLNLFLSQGEVKRLLGLENELYYIREGNINQYAIGFVIPLPSHVDVLHFTWFQSSPLLPLNYKLSFASSDTSILTQPRVNISNSGSVPSQPQVWGVSVLCTGVKAGEVVITVDLILNRMDINKLTNTTLLSFKRKKVCSIFDLSVKEEKVPAYVIFFSAIGGCVLFIVIIITIVITRWIQDSRYNKYATVSVQPQNNLTTQTSVSQTILNRSGGSHASYTHPSGQNLPMLPGLPSYEREERMSITINQGHLMQGSPRLGAYSLQGTGVLYKSALQGNPEELFTSDVDSRIPETRGRRTGPLVPIEEIAVDRLSLTLGDLLQEGTFGRIYQGRLDIDCDSEDVIVKTVVMGSSTHQANKLVAEGGSLYGINHKHVLTLLATTYDGSSPMMIYSYCSPGNLKRWLSSSHQPVNTHQAVCFGLQILTALKHLHKRHIIHRDVAARNCYLSTLHDCKIIRFWFNNAYISRDVAARNCYLSTLHDCKIIRFWFNNTYISRDVAARLNPP